VKLLSALLIDNTSVTSVDTRRNDIDGEAAKELAAAVLNSSSMAMFGEVLIKELRADTLITLDLSSKAPGPTEALVLAGNWRDCFPSWAPS
jgi:hypothetical protein